MKFYRWFFAALATAALAFAGCGDDEEEGGTSTGPTGGGTAITQANVGQVQALVFQRLGQVMAKGPGTYNGAVSGKVKITMTTGKAAQITLKYKLEFDNYSDDGEIYLDGVVEYNVSGTNISYKIDVEISGTYSGSVEGQVNISNGVYSGYWTVNGQRYNF